MSPPLDILAQFLSGIREKSFAGPDADLTLSLDEIKTDGDAVETKMIMPSGDVYLVRVEWLRAESP